MPVLAAVISKTHAGKAVMPGAAAPAKLLVVEDEPLILSYLEDVLEEAGYEVVVARSSDEAIVALDDHATTLSALVTDIRLPGYFNGWHVARQARGLNPDLPILYLTGHGADEWSTLGLSKSLLLQKPVLPRDVLAALKGLIVARSSS